MKRDYFFLIIMIGLALIALVGGFTVVGSPAQARAVKFDDQRVQDLLSLKYNVERAYERTRILPTNLDGLSADELSTGTEIVDPETKQPYEYRTLSSNSYELCAVFSTDLKSLKNNVFLKENSQYVKVGQSCIPYNIPKYMITPTQTPVPEIQSPQDTNTPVTPAVDL